jgi:hypothetical protein
MYNTASVYFIGSHSSLGMAANSDFVGSSDEGQEALLLSRKFDDNLRYLFNRTDVREVEKDKVRLSVFFFLFKCVNAVTKNRFNVGKSGKH